MNHRARARIPSSRLSATKRWHCEAISTARAGLPDNVKRGRETSAWGHQRPAARGAFANNARSDVAHARRVHCVDNDREPDASRPASGAFRKSAAGSQLHLGRAASRAKADQCHFRSVRDQASLHHRPGAEVARAASVLRKKTSREESPNVATRTATLS